MYNLTQHHYSPLNAAPELGMLTTTHYFTFGSDHFLPDGRSAKDEYIAVTAITGMNHRTLLIASGLIETPTNGGIVMAAFAAEYNFYEFQAIQARYYSNKLPAYTISVTGTIDTDQNNQK